MQRFSFFRYFDFIHFIDVHKSGTSVGAEGTNIPIGTNAPYEIIKIMLLPPHKKNVKTHNCLFLIQKAVLTGYLIIIGNHFGTALVCNKIFKTYTVYTDTPISNL